MECKHDPWFNESSPKRLFDTTFENVCPVLMAKLFVLNAMYCV